ncbi:hypothetical protein H721_02628 [Brucella ovis IntaBari-2006-46-332]|nr:hypothetical protein C010_02796 [Brucella ovis 80/125]ENR05794.1 hypothetical protein C961_02496 [Brucella ovis F8/05B]ENS92179.1 hypothetical protein B999_02763 [Brucella ovis 63/96]ENS95691.1 hypothetical protein C009_02644 [Brucella ovis 81/8]ENT75473.1 hypothetical protein H712_02773 [Brucella ovis IntaBari-2009-88-4]ENT77473.1 hypothetical protein H720_02558 [Brucella ovis IntaBari-2006-46-348]ENT80923.1 hypothetical protein H713_02779 [Brucella ovis IntaBari-2010-47-268]ENT85515.1 h
MFIAMNRFKVRIGSETDFETVWKNRDSQLSDCRVSRVSIFCVVQPTKMRAIRSMHPTQSGAARRISLAGPGPNSFAMRIATPGKTSRYILGRPSLKVSLPFSANRLPYRHFSTWVRRNGTETKGEHDCRLPSPSKTLIYV